ncbi:hypothetical protein H671_5g14381, partial [Cricetulus griseus]
ETKFLLYRSFTNLDFKDTIEEVLERVDSLFLSLILEELDRVSLHSIFILAVGLLYIACIMILKVLIVHVFQFLVNVTPRYFMLLVDIVKVYYIDGFSYVEPSLHPWDEAYLIMVDDFSNMLFD